MDAATHNKPNQKARRKGAPSPYSIALRTVAATLGAYAVSALASIALARALPLERSEAITAGVIAALVICCVAALWSFAARTTLRAWLGLLGAACLCGAVIGVSYLGSAP